MSSSFLPSCHSSNWVLHFAKDSVYFDTICQKRVVGRDLSFFSNSTLEGYGTELQNLISLRHPGGQYHELHMAAYVSTTQVKGRQRVCISFHNYVHNMKLYTNSTVPCHLLSTFIQVYLVNTLEVFSIPKCP